MYEPKYKADIQRFLGLVNYFSKLIPDFSTKKQSRCDNWYVNTVIGAGFIFTPKYSTVLKRI